eukprot:UN32833
MADTVKNSAFVFIKPHAVNDKVKALVEKELKANNVTVTGQGVIKAEQIDEGSLIDQHYYAIASKATLLEPKELPVPADKFKEKFGLEWSKALENGQVYNAKQYGAKTKMNATDLENKWRECKKIVLNLVEVFIVQILEQKKNQHTCLMDSLCHYEINLSPRENQFNIIPLNLRQIN